MSSALLSCFLFLLFCENRLEPLQLDPCIRGGEPPVNGHLRLLALLLPGGYFALQGGDIRQTARQALPFQDTQRTRGPGQPGAMLGRGMPCTLPCAPPGFARCEALIPTGRRVGLEVSDHQDKRLGCGIILLDEKAQLLGTCTTCLACRYPHFAPPREGLAPDKEARRPMTGLLVVLPGWLSGLLGERACGGTMECLAGFIETDLGACGIIGALIDVQAVFHLGHTLRGRLGNTPRLSLPRFDRVFFRRAPTAT